MRRITWLIALVLAAGALTVAGCGGDDSSGSSSGGTGTSSSSGGGGQTLTVTADPGGAISWDKTSLAAKSGKVTLKLVNDSDVPHSIEVKGNGVDNKTDVITKSSAEVAVDLKPGKYRYFCPVDEHRTTMKGTLTVS
jgi:plastocyanin